MKPAQSAEFLKEQRAESLKEVEDAETTHPDAKHAALASCGQSELNLGASTTLGKYCQKEIYENTPFRLI